MNKFTRLALLGLVVSLTSVSTLLAGSCSDCGDDDKKKDKKENAEGGDKKE